MQWMKGLAVSAAMLLVGCANAPPQQPDNICSIFRQYPDWYEGAVDMNEAYGTPIQVAMAFVRQESAYVHDARPPRKWFLFIPLGRPSSAYGYAQAQDPAWSDFQKATDYGGSRTDFADAMMFIGWYTSETNRLLGISKWDAYRQYLAYHEGRGGYQRGTYRNKPQVQQVARKVQKQAETYGWQLKQCRAELEDNRSWWPF
ncbi:hypothetical protein VST7929_02254 [Vibrio stylophorae]|uniref:Transglycosylase SLT domain-containing protein n=1 Tax=Vibrio stylophorae TaxID=659351 RepID=A0ABN8DTB3_9VIBR|nr:hypothetical protein [Vibrio stylophorae]CAH0534331.1 hypothetical protein VST7929_02254 [Vibrio stylophorae]